MGSVESAAINQTAPGNLLAELERRQDDALAELDRLESMVAALLNDLGIHPACDRDES